MCTFAEASQSERKEKSGVSNGQNRHLVTSGALFISRLCPGLSGARGKIMAERDDSVVQHVQHSMWNKAVSPIGAVKVSHTHEVAGSDTGGW